LVRTIAIDRTRKPVFNIPAIDGNQPADANQPTDANQQDNDISESPMPFLRR
jgi:hypothetical protein